MVLPQRWAALFYGFLYGLAGSLLVGGVIYLAIATAVLGSPLTGDSRPFLQSGLFVLPFALSLLWDGLHDTILVLCAQVCCVV
jgi:hypothetical protein